MEKKLGSLFDGIGGFPLAAKRNGIRPVWASEIEKFPMAVTMYRFPEMKHMGDITKLHGENLPVVDVIAGGSPCQDLSLIHILTCMKMAIKSESWTKLVTRNVV